MNQMPSIPGSGSIRLTVAPVQALMAGCIRTVDPTGAKAEIRRASHNVTGGRKRCYTCCIPWVSLAPGILVRGHVLRFGKIARAWIQRGIQIIDLHQNPMRYAVVVVAAVLVRCRWKVAGKWIDPCTRTDLVLVAI